MEAFNASIAMARGGISGTSDRGSRFPTGPYPKQIAGNKLEQVRGGKIKLESVIASLKTEVDLASKARDESEANLNQAHSQIQKLNTELRDA